MTPKVQSTPEGREAMAAAPGGREATAKRRPGAAASALSALVVLLAAGCGRSDRDYYPLHPGATAIYDLAVETRNTGSARSEGVAKEKAIVATRAPVTIAKETVVPRIFHNGRAYYDRVAAGGILRAGEKKPDQDMMFAKEETYLLKFPLKPGTSWRAPSETYLLTRVYLGSFGAVTRHLEAMLDMDYTVEAVDDTVTVKAGEFRHCVRVHGQGETTFDWGEPFGVIPFKVEQTEWYAPGVGLVKRLRIENPDPKSPASGRLTQELEDYSWRSWFD
ncbi:MAG: hypothetical protein WCF16_10850 [Alphaproteobacteria bacterium]